MFSMDCMSYVDPKSILLQQTMINTQPCILKIKTTMFTPNFSMFIDVRELCDQNKTKKDAGIKLTKKLTKIVDIFLTTVFLSILKQFKWKIFVQKGNFQSFHPIKMHCLTFKGFELQIKKMPGKVKRNIVLSEFLLEVLFRPGITVRTSD